MKSINIDTSLKNQEFRNIRISKDFWNGIKVSLIDNMKDLDVNLISENKKLIQSVKNLYENGINKINIKDLLNLKIWNPPNEIILGNLRLKNNSDFLISYDYYKIELIDNKKNIDGLWLDSAITTKSVLDVLHKFDFSEKQYETITEIKLYKELEIHFKKYFETVKKGGRSNQGDIDLILGSEHNYGIELKLAKSVKNIKKAQEAIGQIEMYTRQFKDNFMLIIAGLPSEKNEKANSELVKKAKDCLSNYYYLEAI
ncbi:MAG: hypothetical protein Kow0079_15440 [Vicingaceae bacterium]